jgi:iron complex outermembrane receptor protein
MDNIFKIIALNLLLLSSSVSSQDDNSIQEVIVTGAQKREKDIQDVPISISLYSGEFIENSDIRGLQELSLYASNFNISTASQPNNARITIRGIASVGNTAIEPSVGTFFDGVYYARPASVLGLFYDISSAEVLRGPQGTLFGRNTAAGALNITTNDPTYETEIEAGVGYAETNELAYHALASGQLTDKLTGRLAAKKVSRDGYGYNSLYKMEIGAQRDQLARGKLKYQFSETISSKLTVDYNSTESEGSIVELINDSFANAPRFISTLQLLLKDQAANIVTEDDLDRTVYQDHQDFLITDQWGVSLVNDFAINGFELKSITAYRDWLGDNKESALRLPGDILPRISTFSNISFSQELQLISPDSDLFEYVAGLYYYDEDYFIGQDFNAGRQGCFPTVWGLSYLEARGEGKTETQASEIAIERQAECESLPQTSAVASDFDQNLSSYAAYMQGTYYLDKQFSVTLGARLTDDQKKAMFKQSNPNYVVGNYIRKEEYHPDLRFSDTAVTWLANVNYYPVDDTLLFATVSTGYKSGGFNADGVSRVSFPNGLTAEQRVFRSENSKNYELGIKTQLRDDTLTFNMTLYKTELNDFQDRSFDGTSFIVRNAGLRTQQGLEADIAFKPLDELTLISSFSTLDAKFDSFKEASPLPGQSDPQDLSGTRPHFSPKFQGSLVADWRDSLAGTGFEWFVRGEYQYIGEQNIGDNSDNNPQSEADAVALINVRLGLSHNNFEGVLYIKNLEDKAYCETIFLQPIAGELGGTNKALGEGAQRCQVNNSPRIVGASINYIF